MTDTRLILIEGIMGSGKSTTAEYLTGRIQQRGQPARWFHEYAEDNPISGGMDVLNGFDGADDWRLPDKTLPQWQALGQLKRSDDSVTILECKLWQNDALFMLLAGVPTTEVIASNRRVVEAISPASPVLIRVWQGARVAGLRGICGRLPRVAQRVRHNVPELWRTKAGAQEPPCGLGQSLPADRRPD